MNVKVVGLLFAVLSHILSNQQKIMAHMSLTKYYSDHGYDDITEELINKCDSLSKQYEHDN